MRSIFIVSFFSLIVFTSCGDQFKHRPQVFDNNNVGKDVAGDWFWLSQDSTKSFKINLMRQGDSVIGQYCAAYEKGKKLDCEFSNSRNINGRASGDSLILHFHSFYNAQNGLATVKMVNKTLVWRIMNMPVGGDCYAPKDAIMYRKIERW